MFEKLSLKNLVGKKLVHREENIPVEIFHKLIFNLSNWVPLNVVLFYPTERQEPKNMSNYFIT